jgi:hypothetical protein
MDWITPDAIRDQVQRLWERGRILTARLAGEALFPLTVRSARPDARALSDRFAEARDWIRALEANCKDRLGAGYDIVWAESNHRQLGVNRVPQSIVVPSEADALALIGKRRQSESFDRLVELTRETMPALGPWIARHPMGLLEHADDWERILAVVAWFCAHPRPGLYARQIDVPGAHSKFIESRRRLLAELLDLALPETAIDPCAIGAQAFEQRYGLLAKPALIRFRILDERLRIHGLDDLATPAAQFAQLDPPVRRVFITENEINGLAFPSLPDSLIVFGLGYGLERLSQVPWLKNRAVFYWGDIDTHGFAILDSLRGFLPGARSFLMDRDTLLTHRSLWGDEPDRCDKALARLTAPEAALYQDLRTDRLGTHVRLEQERIAFGCLQQALSQVVAGCPPIPPE